MSQTITAPMPLATTDEVMVTGTLVDIWGNKWSQATISMFLVPVQPASNPYLWGGRMFSFSPTITADANGYFFITLPPNSDILPAPNKWRFQITPAFPGGVQPTIFDVSVTAAIDVSSAFTAASSQSSLGTIQALTIPSAPQDSSVATPAKAGALYYNTTNNQVELYTGPVSYPSSGWQVLLTVGGVLGSTAVDLNNILGTGSVILAGGISAHAPAGITVGNSSVLEVWALPGPAYYQRLACPLDPVKYNSIFHRVYNGAWAQWYELVGTPA